MDICQHDRNPTDLNWYRDAGIADYPVTVNNDRDKPLHKRSAESIMEFTAPLEHFLEVFINVLKLLLETIASICVLIGLIRTLRMAVATQWRRNFQLPYLKLRLRFGAWLGLALEFQLGADILNTTVAPSLEALAKLGAITLIRTFLNYFLSKELKEFYELEEKAERQPPQASIL